jgi:hypothetical protein
LFIVAAINEPPPPSGLPPFKYLSSIAVIMVRF